MCALQDLTLECSSLHQEKEELLAELARLQTTSSAAPEIMDQEEDGSLFQQSFTALQVCCIIAAPHTQSFHLPLLTATIRSCHGR